MAIYICGDTHKTFTNFEKIVEENYLIEDDIIIVAGDFGFYFKGDSNEKRFKGILKKLPCQIAFVDGNHENFEMLSKLSIKEMFGSEVGYDEEYEIIHLKRGNIYNIQGHKILTIGGAFSVDRNLRIENVNIWSKKEILSNEEKEKINNLMKYENTVDYIITHTCPKFIVNYFHDYGLLNPETVPNWFVFNTEQEEYFDIVAKHFNFKKWIFGHYHFDINIDKYSCLFENYIKIGGK